MLDCSHIQKGTHIDLTFCYHQISKMCVCVYQGATLYLNSNICDQVFQVVKDFSACLTGVYSLWERHKGK